MRILIDKDIKEMWLKYDKDLALYAGERSVEEALKGLHSYEVRDDCYFIPIYGDRGPAGSFIIGIDESCHPACDYFIAEAYIREEMRGKGLMSKAIKEFICAHPGIYALDIFHENVKARRFWDRVFKESGYHRVFYPYIEHGMDRKISDTYFYEK